MRPAGPLRATRCRFVSEHFLQKRVPSGASTVSEDAAAAVAAASAAEEGGGAETPARAAGGHETFSARAYADEFAGGLAALTGALHC